MADRMLTYDKEERKYSSYSFTSSALDGGEWSASRSSRALPLGIKSEYGEIKFLSQSNLN
jgi:hypothetical protein